MAAGRVLKRVVVFGIVILVLGLGSGIAYLYVSHPRDEGNFLRRVERHWNDDLKAYVDQTPARVVSEGDRACEWLAEQDWVLPDFSGDVAADVTGVGLLARFTQETRGEERLSFDEYQGRITRFIGLAAWQDLCGVTFELRHTHHPFRTLRRD